ncbi:MAG: DUF2207 domain-containing protein, partial [Proteobacteria bacterium]|nr:DUF2207 domain-containing protein [Pseudomonadota bacterium]
MRRLLCLLALAVFSVVVQARERVADFHSAIEIAADGALTVTETIAVVAEGRQIRRGILRDFPTAYRDRLGHRVNVPFEVLAVERDGARETFALEKLSNGVRLRIGSADRLLARGLHTYRITYRTARQLGFFEKHDELYWNVNGNGWTFAFDAVRADVTLPVAVPRTALRAEAYTGPQGARGRHYTAQLRDGGAGFQTTRGLNPYEGLTLVFEFPKGIIAAPTWLQRARWFLAANRGVFAGVAGFLLLLAFYTWRWTLVGRDPREGPKFPRYEPPPRLGPAGARYVDRMGFDNTCFAVGLLGLGARGYLTVRQDGDTFEIERTGT